MEAQVEIKNLGVEIDEELVKEDFYDAVNKKWMDETEIPDDYSRWGTFEILHKKTMENLRELIDNCDVNVKEQKLLHNYYNSYMDTTYRDKMGYTPIYKYLKAIQNIDTIDNLLLVLQILFKDGLKILFGMYAEPDAKDSDIDRPYMCQGGLNLPDMKYYFEDEFKEIREKYHEHMKKMLTLVNYGTDEYITDVVKKIFTFEKSLAKQWMTREDHREIEKVYNKVNRKKFFGKQTNKLLDMLGVTDDVIYDNKDFFNYVETILSMETVDNEVLKHYLTWNLVRGCAGLLSKEFVEESFDFNGRILGGQKKMKEKWMRGLFFLDGNIGESLSKLYVEKYFPMSSKQKMIDMVINLREALSEHIENLDWMEADTKLKALAKLMRFNVKIGFPDKFRDFSSLRTYQHPLENSLEFSRFEYHKNFIERLEKPVDRDRWEMYAHTINAYFHPELNEIVFPAAILQAPFFDPKADDAFNYGAIGAIIGHEMTHGYDDQGRKFDATGNLNDWWTKQDSTNYNKKSQSIVEQYNNYEFFGKNLNGKLTQGENIADLGGVKVAFTAMRKSLEDDTYFSNPNCRSNYSPEQLFFISYAMAWRNKIRKEKALNLLTIDPHSPGFWRVNGVLVNIPEFFRAFNVTDEDSMYNKDVIEIW